MFFVCPAVAYSGLAPGRRTHERVWAERGPVISRVKTAHVTQVLPTGSRGDAANARRTAGLVRAFHLSRKPATDCFRVRVLGF